jgi:two-component system chemotaxis response regulator CheY
MLYTLLIVDDSRVSRLMLRAKLEAAQTDWQFLEAANGQEAITLAQQQTINLVAMDLNMPGIDGLETARQLHALQIQCKIVLLTANVQQSIRDRAAAAQVHFLAKPITDQTVAALLLLAKEA